MAHPAEQFVGMEYDAQRFDCADFVMHVQRALFGRDVMLNGRRPRGARGVAELGALSRQYGVPTDAPEDGDMVLMRNGAGGWHVGVYFLILAEGYVLHCPAEGAGSRLELIRNLPMIVEGYYRWI